MKDLKKKSKIFSRYWWIFIFIVFLIGIAVRYYNVHSYNILFDYDQFEDLFHTKKIILGDFPVIGRPIYGDPNLHHGVFYFYFNLIPFILFKQNPVFIVMWGSLFNAGVAVLLYFFAKSLFNSRLAGAAAALTWAVSSQVVQFSSWISSTSPTMVTVPLFFFGLWEYYKKKDWGLVLALVALGLSIQLELFFLYLIPVTLLYYFIFKPRIPHVKLVIISFFSFFLSILTYILTEIKLGFAGVKSLFQFSRTFDDGDISFVNRLKMFTETFLQMFPENIVPTISTYNWLLGTSLIVIVFYFLLSKKISTGEKKGLVFVLLYLFSPLIMLLWGFHKQPWFLIGIPGAVILLFGYVLTKLKNLLVILIVMSVVVSSNWHYLAKNYGNGPPVFSPEESSLMTFQLEVIDYTYASSKNEPFAINAVSYPLYHNALWEYHYNWYGLRKYGYYPGWLGGDQLFPYKTLPNSMGNEKIVYLIIDNTVRIPNIFRQIGREWARGLGTIEETKEIGGFSVEKIRRK